MSEVTFTLHRKEDLLTLPPETVIRNFVGTIYEKDMFGEQYWWVVSRAEPVALPNLPAYIIYDPRSA